MILWYNVKNIKKRLGDKVALSVHKFALALPTHVTWDKLLLAFSDILYLYI
jgi:hypothetical protein